MQIQSLNSQYTTSKGTNKFQKDNLSFGNISAASNVFLRFLETNQAIGANSVDLCFGVIPRTTYDTCKRGKDTGVETARREFSGLANHSLIGIYGMLGGALLTSAINKKFPGVKPNNILLDNTAIDILAQNWHDTLNANSNEPIKDYLKKVTDEIKVFSPQTSNNNGWIKIPQEIQTSIVDKLDNLIKNSPNKNSVSEAVEYVRNLIISSTGSERIMLESGKKQTSASLNVLVENICNISQVFNKSEIKKMFHDTTDIAKNAFVKSLKSMNINRMLIGLGIATTIGVSTQPLNKYLTYKKTGQRGFVGVPGRKEDTSTGFKILRTISGLAFAAFALSTITRNPKNLMNKLQFKGYIPTLEQFKFVYGLTIASRLFAARDKDELRESTIKDTLSFLNLLILGAFVTKGVARLFNKSKSLFHSLPKGVKGGGFFGAKLKTRDEVLLSALDKNGISTVENGKAIKYSELLKLKDKLPDEELKALNKDMHLLAISQVLGYLYSGLVLGLGVPALNKHMTAKSEAKFKAQYAAKLKEIKESEHKILEESNFVKNDKNSVWKQFLNLK